MEGFIVISAIIVIGFFLFSIYFMFKLIQFVIVAVNLYKKMVKRQDAMIKILLDIRDQTKSFKQKEIVEELEEKSKDDILLSQSLNKNQEALDADEEPLEFCYHCGAELKKKVKKCPKCGKKL